MLNVKSAVLTHLKSLIAPKTHREILPFSLLPVGIPKGAITEISGQGKTEFVLHFLKQYPQHMTAWVEKRFSAYPFAFAQYGVNMGHVLFIEGESSLDWCVYQALRTTRIQTVVIYADDIHLKSLRRIQLQSEKSQAVTFWLTDSPKEAWPVALRLVLNRDPAGFHTRILKQRF